MVVGQRSALVVEDDRLLASLISGLLSDHGFTCHVAHDVSGAKKILRTAEIDVALLDIHLGEGPSGVQLASALEKTQPGVGIVFLTKTPDLVAAGIELASLPQVYGVAGKDNIGSSDELLDAIESVLSTRRSPVRHDKAELGPLRDLTTHQRSVLKLVASGLTNKAIAERTQVTERSVERSLQAIFRHLSIDQDGERKPRVEAIRHYVEAFGFPPRR